MNFARGLLLISLPLLALDQVTKAWIVARYAAPIPEFGIYESTEIIPGFFWIGRVHNTGVAFGLYNGGANANIIFGSVAVAALGLLTLLWRKGGFHNRPARLAVFLLISGVLGNLADRLSRGYVVDFLRFDLQFMEWPSFNVADSCICIAAGLLVLSAFLPETRSAPIDGAEKP